MEINNIVVRELIAEDGKMITTKEKEWFCKKLCLAFDDSPENYIEVAEGEAERIMEEKKNEKIDSNEEIDNNDWRISL